MSEEAALIDLRIAKELELLDAQAMVTDDRVRLMEIEHQKQSALNRKKERDAEQAAQKQQGHTKRASAALKLYGDNVTDAGRAMYDAIFASALGQEKAFQRALYAFTYNTAKELGFVAAKEAVLALVAVARYDYASAAMHGAAAAAAGAAAAAMGGGAYALGKGLSADQRGSVTGADQYREEKERDSKAKPARKAEKGPDLEESIIPQSPVGLQRDPAGITRAGATAEPKVVVERVTVFGADKVEVGRAMDDLIERSRRALGKVG